MTNTEASTPDIFADEEQGWEEEWMVIMTTKGKYTLSKMQALVLKQALATGSRSTVMFETFSIAIPYLAEFYRVKRFQKNAKQLPATAMEKEYQPISPERWEEIKKEMYRKIGRS